MKGPHGSLMPGKFMAPRASCCVGMMVAAGVKVIRASFLTPVDSLCSGGFRQSWDQRKRNLYPAPGSTELSTWEGSKQQQLTRRGNSGWGRGRNIP